MKGKATMALVLSLVVGIIINYGVMTPTAKVFATAIGEHQPQPPPEAKQDPLSEQQRYNAAAMKVLAQMSIPVNKTLPKTTSITDSGTEIQHKNDWITVNHDIFYTRSSPQTIIGKDNVNKLQVKWIFTIQYPIEQSPLIIGDKVYVQDNKATVYALDVNTGLNLWKAKTGQGASMHGMTYNSGMIFTGTGGDARVAAINATTGTIIWKSPRLGPPNIGYSVNTPPIVWKDYVVVGSAGGDVPPSQGIVQGNVTALNRTNGDVLWNFHTTVGNWVGPGKTPPNGGVTTWTGGSLDPQTGILYIPAGNASPDFNATTRQGDQKYANNMLAINIRNGGLVWATPFIAQGTIFKNVKLPDTHDYDTAWGSTISEVKLDNGTQKKVIIGTDKRGDIMAMDAATGKPLWWTIVGTLYRDNVEPKLTGSGLIIPGAAIQGYHAINNNTLYVAATSDAYNFFAKGEEGFLEPVFNATKSGVGNGTITAIDIKSGKIKWHTPIDFPTRVSPLVTNEVVFSGYMTSFGKPYTADLWGNPIEGRLQPTGIIMALDSDTGKILWQFNVGYKIGVGGPSIGHGMLFVPTEGENIGSLIAFGLP